MNKVKILLSEEPTMECECPFVRATVVSSLLTTRLTVTRMLRWISANVMERFEMQLDMLRNTISQNVHSVSH